MIRLLHPINWTVRAWVWITLAVGFIGMAGGAR